MAKLHLTLSYDTITLMLRIKTNGFTIVEMLTVIVVIAILSAITFVTYDGMRERSYTTTIRSDLRNAAEKMKLYAADTPTAQYPTTLANLKSVTSNVFTRDAYFWAIYCTDGASYVIAARRPSATKWLAIGSGQSLIETANPGVSGSADTTCANLGYPSATYKVWIKSTSGWAI